MVKNHVDYHIANLYLHEWQPVKLYNSSFQGDKGTWQVALCSDYRKRLVFTGRLLSNSAH